MEMPRVGSRREASFVPSEKCGMLVAMRRDEFNGKNK
jgi:hypothetical protein